MYICKHVDHRMQGGSCVLVMTDLELLMSLIRILIGK